MNTNRKELEDRLVDLTLEAMDIADDTDCTRLALSIVSAAWISGGRFPTRVDLDNLDGILLEAAIEEMEAFIYILETDDMALDEMEAEIEYTDNRDKLMDLTLDMLELCDDLDMKEMGESLVGEIWKVEFRLPVKSDMNWMDDDEVDTAIRETMEYIEWIKANCE